MCRLKLPPSKATERPPLTLRSPPMPQLPQQPQL
jgi:hypothetical protein